MILWAMDGIVAEPAEQLKTMQNARLEALLTGVMDRAVAGDGEAVATCLKILRALSERHGRIVSSARACPHSGC